MKHAGSWSFTSGLFLAIIIGVVSSYTLGMSSAMIWLLTILGILVGFLNVTEKEVTPFLYAGTIIVIVTSLAVQTRISGEQTIIDLIPLFGDILTATFVLFVPATVIVAIRSAYTLTNK